MTQTWHSHEVTIRGHEEFFRKIGLQNVHDTMWPEISTNSNKYFIKMTFKSQIVLESTPTKPSFLATNTLQKILCEIEILKYSQHGHEFDICGCVVDFNKCVDTDLTLEIDNC
jgi:hypothetical protein